MLSVKIENATGASKINDRILGAKWGDILPIIG